MFCKIKKGKNYFTIYACNRERVNGKVVSNDRRICRLAWHSLYEDDEEVNGLKKEISVDLYFLLSHSYFMEGRTGLNFDKDVVPKLEQIKKEYYPTYKKEALEAARILEKELKEKKKKEKEEYEYFKNKYRLLFNEDMTKKLQEGYKIGAKTAAYYNIGSGITTSYNSEEIKLLKEAFKLLAMKHHPDRGGDNETMAAINNLKGKILEK